MSILTEGLDISEIPCPPCHVCGAVRIPEQGFAIVLLEVWPEIPVEEKEGDGPRKVDGGASLSTRSTRVFSICSDHEIFFRTIGSTQFWKILERVEICP